MARSSLGRKALSTLVAATMVVSLNAPISAWAGDDDASQPVAIEESGGGYQEVSLTADSESGVPAAGVAYVKGQTTGYKTLDHVINSIAKSGDTVVLRADATEYVKIPEGKNITLDLNGHKLTTSTALPTIRNYGTLTVIDSSTDKTGTIDNTAKMQEGTDKGSAISNAQGATCTIESAQITRSGDDASGNGTYFCIENLGTMTIGAEGDANASKNVNVSSNGTIYSLIQNGWSISSDHTTAGDATLTINGGTFTGGNNAVFNNEYGDLTINGGDFENTANHAIYNVNKATINGGSFASAVGTAIYTSAGASCVGDTTVYGGTFTSSDDSTSDIKLSNGTIIPTTTVYGGTFSKDPSPYVDEDYAVEKNAADAYVVKVAVAKHLGKGYTTLQAAIDSVDDIDTVTMMASTTESVIIDKQLTLDLNGYTLNGGTVANKAALSITDGAVTIEDTSTAQTGTIKREDVASSGGTSSYYVIDIQKSANVTFKSGKVTNDSGTMSLVRVGYDDKTSDYNPVLTIEGGTFEQNNFVAIENAFGTLNVNGGTIKCSKDEAIKNWRNTTINGGTVEGTVASWAYNETNSNLVFKRYSNLVINAGAKIFGDVYAMNYEGKANTVAKVSITGGFVSGSLGIYKGTSIAYLQLPDSGTTPQTQIEVTGGTFVKNPSDAFDPNGFNIVFIPNASDDCAYYTLKNGDYYYVIYQTADSQESESGTNGLITGTVASVGVDVGTASNLRKEALSAARIFADKTQEVNIPTEFVADTPELMKVGDTTIQITGTQAGALKEAIKLARQDNTAVEVAFYVLANKGVEVNKKIADAAPTGAEVIPFTLSVAMWTNVYSSDGSTTASFTGSEALADVVETGSPIEATIKVDASSIEGKNVSIARYHYVNAEDVVEILPADVNYATGEVTFEADEFSDYAVIATDENPSYELADYTNTDGTRRTIDPTKFGYTSDYVFAGWYTDPEKTIAYVPEAVSGRAYPKFVKISDLIEFQGGSLRMDLTGKDDYTKTSLRFGYRMKVPEGATLDKSNWGWKYKSSVNDKETSLVNAKNYWMTDDNGAIANLVLTPIYASDHAISYGTDFQVKAQIAYTTTDGTYVTAIDDSRTRSVESVVLAISANTFAPDDEKTYAAGILNAIKNS